MTVNGATSMAEMLVEECCDLSECFLSLRRAIIGLVLSMRLPLVNFELRIDSCLPKLSMYAHRIAEQQVPCTSAQDRGWKAMHITINRRQQRILEIMTVRIDYGRGVTKSVTRY